MNPEFVRCSFCKSVILSEHCQLAAYSTTIDGKQYLFCCEQCAKRYQEEKKKRKK